ncbi:hypothetical protein ZWY2020_051883 [Hordeum vulgare]|nr:hypothetical protein ZWY2020_051883 [Hordeum vulgare]
MCRRQQCSNLLEHASLWQAAAICRPERCKPAILEAVMNPKSILVAAPVYSFPRIMNGGKPLLQLDLDV